MGQLRDRMAADLALRGLSSATCAAYLRYVEKFVVFHKRSPRELGVEHVRMWVLHLLQVLGRNPNTVNVCIVALRFLFDTTLQRPDVMASVRLVRTRHHQPDVPGGSQVAAILAHARNATDRAMFMLLYGSGAACLGDAGAGGCGHRQHAHGDPRARHQESPRPHRCRCRPRRWRRFASTGESVARRGSCSSWVPNAGPKVVG